MHLSPISVNNLIFIFLVLKFGNFSISQMAGNKMKFVSKDDQTFEVDEEVAKQSQVLSDMLEFLSEAIDYSHCMILELNVFELSIMHNNGIVIGSYGY